ARRRALGVVLAVEVGQELTDDQRLAAKRTLVNLLWRHSRGHLISGNGGSRRSDLAAEELAKLDQVSAVAFDRIVAEMLLQSQIVQELSDQRGEVFFVRGRLLRDGRLRCSGGGCGGIHRYRTRLI